MKGIIGREMRLKTMFYGIKGYNKNIMKILKSIYLCSKDEEVSFRL